MQSVNRRRGLGATSRPSAPSRSWCDGKPVSGVSRGRARLNLSQASGADPGDDGGRRGRRTWARALLSSALTRPTKAGRATAPVSGVRARVALGDVQTSCIIGMAKARRAAARSGGQGPVAVLFEEWAGVAFMEAQNARLDGGANLVATGTFVDRRNRRAAWSSTTHDGDRSGPGLSHSPVVPTPYSACSGVNPSKSNWSTRPARENDVKSR